MRDAYLLTEYGSLERLWREVALHLPDVLFTEKLKVFESGVFLVIDSHRAHLVKRLVEPFEVFGQIRRNGLVLLFELGYALLRLPNLVDCALDGVNQLCVHLIHIVQEPRALGSLRHIRKHERINEVIWHLIVTSTRDVLHLVVVDDGCDIVLLLEDFTGLREEGCGGVGARDGDNGCWWNE